MPKQVGFQPTPEDASSLCLFRVVTKFVPYSLAAWTKNLLPSDASRRYLVIVRRHLSLDLMDCPGSKDGQSSEMYTGANPFLDLNTNCILARIGS
jgi:hypothetical protein